MDSKKYFDSLYPSQTRSKELVSLIPYIEQGLSSQVVGVPGCGKSNILRLLAYNRDVRFQNYGEAEKLLHFVYIDCSEVKGRALFDITKFILISLSFSLGERGLVDESRYIDKLLRDELSTSDEMLLFQALKKSLDYLSIEKKLSIHLLFDKFDVLIPTIDTQFFTNLRILRNHAKYRFASIFALTRPLEESVEPMLLTDFYDLVAQNIVFVSLYDKIGMDFRLSYIEKASRKNLSESVQNEVLRLTAGHAQLTKLSYEALLAEDNEPENIESFLFKKTSIQGTLFSIWASLLPSEQIVLKQALDFKNIQTDFSYLLNSGLVDENGITIPLFKNFVNEINIKNADKIIYDTDKNEIKLGEESVSDKLSPLEFKLLKYLIENKEKICSKDEIINSVWSNQKTQEGVTDQALDQIFYRLRKKIEKDPTSPQYIHTVKGKGYRLTD